MSVCAQLGKETLITALGRTWTIGRWTISVWDRLLEWAKPRLPDPFQGLDKLVDKLPPDMAERIIKEAQAKAMLLVSINSPEILHVLDGTLEGRVRVLYELLRQHHPDITPNTVFEILTEVGLEQMQDAIVRSQGQTQAGGDVARAA